MNRQPTESSRLLCQQAVNEPLLSQGQQKSSKTCSYKYLCLPSKAAILIIFWTVVVGAVYNLVLLLAVAIVDTNPLFSHDISISANECLPYAILALISLFYPLSGFIADVCCGRLKVVAVSLCFILTFVLLLCFSIIVMLTGNSHSLTSDMIFHQTKETIVFILIPVSLIIFFIGLAGYQANMIQLGLDQLFEAPSQYLSLFILYASWAFKLGSIPIAAFIPLLLCTNLKHFIAIRALILSPFVIGAFLILLLIVSWWKRRYFYTDRSSRLKNPYIQNCLQGNQFCQETQSSP